MSTTTKTKLATRALAFAGALSLFAANSVSAALVADGTPGVPVPSGVPLAPVANFGGTVQAGGDTTFAFAESFNLPPLFTGTLRSVVVKNAGGTLDFYYQINVLTQDPGFDADIFRLTIDGFDPFIPNPAEMDTISNGLSGIAASVVGTKGALTADRDPSLGSGVGFTFGGIGAASNLDEGETSFFMLVRTNATAFTTGQATVSGFGTAYSAAYVPTAVSAIPEPGSALVGLAVMGLCGSGVFRRNRRHVVA